MTSWQHLLDPHHAGPGGLESRDRALGFAGQLGCVGGAGEEDELGGGVELVRRGEQVVEALLRGDASDEHDGRPVRVDAEPLHDVRAGVGRVRPGVDAVRDHMQASRIQPGVPAHDVVSHRLADRDHRRRAAIGGLLSPRRQPVAAAELLLLPGPRGLERVGGDDVGDAVEEARQVTREVGVPGVGVDDVRACDRRRHLEVGREDPQRGIGAGQPRVVLGVSDRPGPRLAEAVHLEVDT